MDFIHKLINCFKNHFIWPIPTLPYQIDYIILPEILEWCYDNNCMNKIIVGLEKPEPTQFNTEGMYKVTFNFGAKLEDPIHREFLNFIEKNRWNFYKKNKKYEMKILTGRSFNNSIQTKSDKIDSHEAIKDIIYNLCKLIRSVNHLIGAKNWYICPHSNLFIADIYVYRLHSFFGYAEFFDKKDENLYKLSFPKI